jgi:hypothetical protein
MPSRLDELRRHRALLQEHLAWLDREIAAAAGERPPSSAAAGLTPVRPAASQPPPSSSQADDLFARLSAEEQKRSAAPSKTGCWLIFSGIILLFCGVVAAVAHYIYR